MKDRLYRRGSKRCFDVIVAAGLLLVLSPLLAVVALLVRFILGQPVLFCQQRPGRGGRLFTLLKFRTMTDACDADGRPLADEVRLTCFGRWLRSSSLDELPELWNVLRGEMSLVGPRPWLPQYLGLYTDEQTRRHEVRPGITGWAQVNGRNRACWDDRLAMDVWYVDHCTMWLDLRILALTVITVLRRSDVNAPGHATMPPFTGSGSGDEVSDSLSVDREQSPLQSPRTTDHGPRTSPSFPQPPADPHRRAA